MIKLQCTINESNHEVHERVEQDERIRKQLVGAEKQLASSQQNVKTNLKGLFVVGCRKGCKSRGQTCNINDFGPTTFKKKNSAKRKWENMNWILIFA